MGRLAVGRGVIHVVPLQQWECRGGDDRWSGRLVRVYALQAEEEFSSTATWGTQGGGGRQRRRCRFGRVAGLVELNGSLHAFVANPVGEIPGGGVCPSSRQRNFR